MTATGVLLAAAILASCEQGATDKSADRRPSRPPTTSDDPGSRLVSPDGDRDALQQLIEQPNVNLRVQYAAPLQAAAKLEGCDDAYDRCRVAVLVTRDNWASEVHLVLPDIRAFGRVWVKALPGGAAAVVAESDRDFDSVPPFVLHSDGTVTGLSISAHPRDPARDSVLVERPPVPHADNSDGLWVLDPDRGELYPAAHQPCDCNGRWVQPVSEGDGVVHARIERLRGGRNWQLLAHSRNNGRSWGTTRAVPTHFAPYPGGYVEFAAGPGRRLAIAWFSDRGTDIRRMRLFVSNDERTWRRVATGSAPKHIFGMAFTPDGTLLVANLSHRLWRLRPGATTLRPMRGGPPGEVLQTSGGVIIAHTERRSVAVSTDGTNWKTIGISSMVPPDASPPPRRDRARVEYYLLRRDREDWAY